MPKLIIMLLLCGVFALAELPPKLTFAELVDNARQFDGKTVRYCGEVIGDILPRGGKVWLNVHDGENAIGIFADREAAAKIRMLGNYRQRGDSVEILGHFHRACAEHGGDLDIHAVALAIREPGYAVERQPGSIKIVLTIMLVLTATALAFLNLRNGDRN
ncbi:hypothetical protein NO2_1542 [Candidatus Termititenax persephonae]|uniref:DNA-binding protein n=1 Tax=Candidatus Termititenax persephonae TaxID=2218525 RepID=A0A388TJN0_9BACT|nr:hypothetical protein NO2_1542 [Candidatus Termititenax persephonae]